MATLTEVAYYSRNIIKYSGLFILGYIILQFIFKFSIDLYKQLNPPPPPAPSMGFGALPKLYFAQTGEYKFNFLLQTPDGNFPVFSDRANVYYIPPKKASLFAYTETEKMANSYRFFGTGEQVGKNLYQWQKNIPQTLTIKIDSLRSSFSYEYAWQADTSLLSDKKALTEEMVYQIASNFIKQSGQNITDIFLNEAKLSYYKASGDKMVPVLSLSEADFIKVDYFRIKIDEYQVVTHKPQDGIISLIISRSNQFDKQVISAAFNYYSINYLQPETYPLAPIATAWEKLKAGQAYIASNNNNSEEIKIRRIELAYFDPPVAQEFFQPIYVFRGDNDFIAYLPAIADNVTK